MRGEARVQGSRAGTVAAGGLRVPPPVPAMNLLRPGLPARRARAAAVVVAVLLLVSVFDLLLVLGWAGLSLRNDRAEGAMADWRSEEARWQAQAAEHAGTIQDRWLLLQHLAVLDGLPSGYEVVQALAVTLAEALPEGATIATAHLGEGGFIVITGTAPAHEAVERYVRALQASGMFQYVRVAAVSRAAAGEDGSTAAGTGMGGVTFQVEAWLKEAGDHGGGV